MAPLAPILQAFFTDYLVTQRRCSPATIAAYRDGWKLLLTHVHGRTGNAPATLEVTDLNADVISGFLTSLETGRGNSIATRNARLAAIHCLFAYAALRTPEHADLIARVLAIPPKQGGQPQVCFLTATETTALLAAPDRSTWLGRRDHAFLHVATQTGMRNSELTGLARHDAHLGTGPNLHCTGKRRKERSTPLTRQTVQVLADWLAERGGQDSDPIFCTRRGGKLSRDAVERLVAKHTATAAATCPSLRDKHVTPHTLRHTAAMALLHSGVDVTVIALWLGHESTNSVMAYVHADMAMKEQALARVAPHDVPAGRYQPSDTLLNFLTNL